MDGAHDSQALTLNWLGAVRPHIGGASWGDGPVSADFVAEVGDYYARGLPRFVDTSSYYAAFGER
jgi:hypothetical protein